MNRIREIHLFDKNQQALERAQKNKERKREKMRKTTSGRNAKVQARRNLMEKKQRERLTSMECKLHSAVSRAEQICRKKQIKARNIKRAGKAKKRRELLEFERRSALLSGVDRRSEKAQKNIEMILKDRKCKARGEIEHAQRVSRRVRAARILQRAARAVFGVTEPQDKGSAAVQIQCWAAWRLNVASHRFVSKGGVVTSPLESLKNLLSKMGHHNVSFSRSSISFEMLTTEMGKDETLHAANIFLSAFQPILGTIPCISDRTLLSVFLIDQQPIAVLGPKRDTDKCSSFLERCSHRLVKVLIDLARMNDDENHSYRAATVKDAAACLLSYCTLFEKWKNADIDNLVMQMAKSATQSWIAYFTAKDTRSYIEEKEKCLVSGNGDPFFQHKIRSKSSKRGAWSHIKRIHSSLQKLLGVDEALGVMKSARKKAMERIDEDDLLKESRSEIDIVCETEAEEAQSEDSASVGMQDAAALDDVNKHVVHEILLADNDDLSGQLFKDPVSSVVDCVESFMAKFKSDISQCEVTADTFAFKMEKAFFDQMKDNWIHSKDVKGMHEMLAEIFMKMRNLVPKRTDLHNYFSHDEALRCSTACDFLEMLARIGNVMGDSLESPHRAESTLQWLKATVLFCSGKTNVPFGFPDIESYVVVSMAFLVKKLDVCHADIVNYRLVKVTPLIRANGIGYERQRFGQKHGSTIDGLHGTKSWLERMKPAIVECNANLVTILKEGFVDELLFVQERISMPEVLCLDAARIGSIRERIQRIVISSSLFLHACNIVHIRFASLQSEEALSKVKFDKNEIMKSLKNNLSYDELYKKVSSSVVSFAKGMLLPLGHYYISW